MVHLPTYLEISLAVLVARQLSTMRGNCRVVEKMKDRADGSIGCEGARESRFVGFSNDEEVLESLLELGIRWKQVPPR